MTRVKICGVTGVEDARACHLAGADLLGVILTESPRQVSPAAAARIRAAVPTVRLVAVVRDGDEAELARRIDTAGVDVVQLHGCADPVRWRAVAQATRRAILPAVTADQADAAITAWSQHGDLRYEGLLLDLPKDAPDDATARELLWQVAARAVAAGVPVFLAGSLAAADVPSACRRVQPLALDVCRGTERSPGRKDLDLVRRFVAAAHAVEEPRVF